MIYKLHTFKPTIECLQRRIWHKRCNHTQWCKILHRMHVLYTIHHSGTPVMIIMKERQSVWIKLPDKQIIFSTPLKLTIFTHYKAIFWPFFRFFVFLFCFSIFFRSCSALDFFVFTNFFDLSFLHDLVLIILNVFLIINYFVSMQTSIFLYLFLCFFIFIFSFASTYTLIMAFQSSNDRFVLQ